MPINRRILSQDAAVSAGDADSAQGLVLHLDANDEDSIESGGANTGSGSGTWFDIANHDLNAPLVDKASNLKVHLNASDTTSYSGSGGTWNDISGSGLNASISGASFGSDTRGYFDFSGAASDLITIPDSSFVDMESNSTMEVWLQKPTTTCHIINKGAGDGNESYAFWAQSNKVYFYRYDASGGTTTALNISTSSIATDEYMHVAITVGSSGDFKMYLNGGSQVSASISTFRDNSNSVRIGNFNTSNQFPYTERLSVVRFYNTALTASEVAQNFRAGHAFSYDSIYSTNLIMHLDAGDDTSVSASTWSDKANSNDVTLSGFSSTLSDFYDKELGNWLNFDGSDDTGDISHHSDLDLSTTFTIEAWVQRNDNSERYIFTKQGGSLSFGYALQFHPSSSFGYTFIVYNTANGIFQTAATIAKSGTAGEWQHVVGVIDGTNIILYINGEQVATQSYTGTLADSDGVNLFLGRYPAGATRWLGKIGQARIYQSSLSATEVGQNYLVGKKNYPNGHNATIYGSTFGANLSSPNESRFVFDGANDYMHLDTYVHPNIPLYSISMFVKFPDATPSGNKYFLSNITTSNNEITSNIHFGLLTTGNFVVMIGDGSGVDNFQTASNLSNDTYAHLVFTFDGVNDEVKYYKDGSLQSTTSSMTRIGSQNAQADLYIGRYGESNLFYTAMTLGQLKIFHKVLSASEVTAEFDANKATYGLS